MRGIRGAPALVMRRDATVHAVPAFSSGFAPSASVRLTASGGGGGAFAGGGDVSLRIVPYEVGQAIRQAVDPTHETMYVAGMATTGGFVGGVLTGGAAWGEGVGFVAGWVVAVRQVRRRRR